MQPRLIVKILPLKPQVLLDVIDRQFLNRPPRLIRRLPDNLPFSVRHLQRRTNLVGMEVVKLLLFTFCLIDPRQRRITPRLVSVKTALPRTFLPQHAQALPQEVFQLGYAINNGLLTDPPPQAVVPIRSGTFQLAIDQRLGLDQAIFTVINKRLQFAHATAFFNQVAPRIVGIFLIPPAFEAVVFDVVKLAGVEVQPVCRGVVAEFFAVEQLAGVTAVQLAVGFVFVLDLAAQFVEGADQFAGRVVLVTAVDRVVGMLDQQVGLDAGVVDSREFFCRQARSKLPILATKGVVAEAAGERALGAQDFRLSQLILLFQPVFEHSADTDEYQALHLEHKNRCYRSR